MQEHEAIAAVRSGDQQAFAWLVGRYQHMVYTVCNRVLRDAQEAEEAAQDSFVKVYQHITGYQGGSKFSTWLYSIAYRTAISKLRARPGGTSGLDDITDEVVAEHEEPIAEATDRRTALDLALSRLPESDAAIVSLYYLGEQSVDEIVTATGLTASNVKVRLHRSRKKLFDILKDHLKEEAWTLR